MFVKSSEGLPGSQPSSDHMEQEEGVEEEERPQENGTIQGPATRPDTPGQGTSGSHAGIPLGQGTSGTVVMQRCHQKCCGAGAAWSRLF